MIHQQLNIILNSQKKVKWLGSIKYYTQNMNNRNIFVFYLDIHPKAINIEEYIGQTKWFIYTSHNTQYWMLCKFINYKLSISYNTSYNSLNRMNYYFYAQDVYSCLSKKKGTLPQQNLYLHDEIPCNFCRSLQITTVPRKMDGILL